MSVVIVYKLRYCLAQLELNMCKSPGIQHKRYAHHESLWLLNVVAVGNSSTLAYPILSYKATKSITGSNTRAYFSLRDLHLTREVGSRSIRR